MLNNKEKVSEYSKMIMETNAKRFVDTQQERQSISEYIRKALEAKPDKDSIFSSSCKRLIRQILLITQFLLRILDGRVKVY